MDERFERPSPEVLLPTTRVVGVTRDDIAEFERLAEGADRRRIRLCAHGGADAKVHEMLIVHEHGTYVRPHRHPGKSESFHVVAGEADCLVFDDSGAVTQVIPLGAYESGRTFFLRLADPTFHSLIIRTPVIVFHETTVGPFVRGQTEFAPWSPADGDEAVARYMRELESEAAGRR